MKTQQMTKKEFKTVKAYLRKTTNQNLLKLDSICDSLEKGILICTFRYWWWIYIALTKSNLEIEDPRFERVIRLTANGLAETADVYKKAELAHSSCMGIPTEWVKEAEKTSWKKMETLPKNDEDLRTFNFLFDQGNTFRESVYHQM